MWGLIGSAVGAAADYLGGGRQMRFQERMSSTAYQRAVEDMRRAGLNPALAYSQGGASSPPGADWSPGRSIAEGASSAGRYALEKKLNAAQVRATEQTGEAAESNALTAAKGQALRENEYNRDTKWLAVDRAYQQELRKQEVQQAGTSTALLRLSEKGATADLMGREYEASRIRAIESTLDKSFGKGTMRDIARIVLMILQSNAGSSAIRMLPGRR